MLKIGKGGGVGSYTHAGSYDYCSTGTNYALALDDLNAHQYEEISKYQALSWSTQGTVPENPEKEFSVSVCPAYTSTPKSACQRLELEYDEVRTVTMQGQRALSRAESAGDYEKMQPAQASNMEQGQRPSEPHYESQY